MNLKKHKKIVFLKNEIQHKYKKIESSDSRQFKIYYVSKIESIINKLMKFDYDAVAVLTEDLLDDKILADQIKDFEVIFSVIKISKDCSDSELLQIFESKFASDDHQEKMNIYKKLKILIAETNFSVAIEILNMFLLRREEYQKISNEYINKNDIQGIQFLAHNLKSTSANIGAVKMPKICQFIENKNIQNWPIALLIRALFYEYKKTNELARSIMADLVFAEKSNLEI